MTIINFWIIPVTDLCWITPGADADDDPEDGGDIPGNVRKIFRWPSAVRFNELLDVMPKKPTWSMSFDKDLLGLSIPPSIARRLGKRLEKILGPELREIG